MKYLLSSVAVVAVVGTAVYMYLQDRDAENATATGDTVDVGINTNDTVDSDPAPTNI